LIEILDEHRANGVETQLDEVWKEFKRDLRQLEEDADKVEDRKLSDRVSVGQEEYTDGAEARELAEDISVALDEYQGRSDRFARILDGGTKASTRQHLQSAFNRRSSWPMVLVAQSLVGREGLNLHKACRTVVLFQPEWNPGVVEQQIGRVDRMGSLWEEMVKQDPSNKTIRIRVLPVMFRGTYDEHNWKVLMARWDDYRAQMSGEVFAVNCNDDPELSNLKEMVNKSAPDFTPPSIVR
jgi:hypothetical protein